MPVTLPERSSESVRAPLRRKIFDRGIAGATVRASPALLVPPAECACCGAPAARATREASGGAELLVPYCTECHYHVSAVATRNFAISASSLLGALSAAAVLPLIVALPLALHALAVFGLAVGPIAVGWFFPFRRASGHTAAGKAVWWQRDGAVACTNPAWARALAERAAEPVGQSALSAAPAEQGGQPVQHDSRRLVEPRWSAWMALGPAAAVLATVLSYELYFPVIRVLNLTDETLWVSADGRQLLVAEPAHSESPEAGLEVRAPAGRVQLRAVDGAGNVVDERSATLAPGAVHLYAPASDGYCFWYEITDYGRSGSPRAERRPQMNRDEGPAARAKGGAGQSARRAATANETVADESQPARLMGDERASPGSIIELLPVGRGIWHLRRRIDTWFAPNPATVADSRSTGGRLVALRQALCREAPAPVRGLASVSLPVGQRPQTRPVSPPAGRRPQTRPGDQAEFATEAP